MSSQNTHNKEFVFHVTGMHCKACTLMIESELKDLPNITIVKVNLASNTVLVVGDFGNKTPEQIAKELTAPLTSHGYSLSIDVSKSTKNKWTDFKIALPVALVFAIMFIVLQKIGLVNLVNSSNVTYGTAFVIGIIASLSTCMAVVGGLLLSMSATFAKDGDSVRPQTLFHVGRLISFFILGGVIGMIGSAFTLNTSMIFILSLSIGIVMLILGINLLDIFPWAKRLQPSMPRFVTKHIHGISKINHTLTPFLVGIITFFLPCGFTQSMQLYTLSTGSFFQGGMTMFVYALGTLPVLALISFSSVRIQNSSKAGIFFKSAGLIVIMFAILNIVTSLIVIGIIPPLFNF